MIDCEEIWESVIYARLLAALPAPQADSPPATAFFPRIEATPEVVAALRAILDTIVVAEHVRLVWHYLSVAGRLGSVSVPHLPASVEEMQKKGEETIAHLKARLDKQCARDNEFLTLYKIFTEQSEFFQIPENIIQ